MNDKDFERLLAAYLDGETGEEDLAKLHEAVHSSQTFSRRFKEASRQNVLLREVMLEETELQGSPESPASYAAAGPGSFMKLLKAAAAFIAIGAIVSGAWFFFSDYSGKDPIGTFLHISGNSQVQIERNSRILQALSRPELRAGDRVVCGSRSQAMISLADGSILSMEPDSCLSLVSDQPQVTLEKGEVLFEITERKKGIPAFTVVTGQSTVAVLGTMFSLQAGTQTQVKVYEGSVTFTRNHDKATVKVKSKQMATTGSGILAVQDLSQESDEKRVSVLNLIPTDDTTLERGRRVGGPHLKVEGKNRVVYMRFDIPDLNTILSAKLRLTQDIDPGSGTLKFHLGDHTDWTEKDLTKALAPAPLHEIAERRGVVQRREVIETDLSHAIKEPGPVTLIITLDKTKAHDIWFGSRESDIPPQLILTYLSQSPDTSGATEQ